MLVMHHYMDTPSDRLASPPKRTTVVYLGTRWSRGYAAGMTAAAAAIYGTLAASVNPAFVLGVLLTVPAIWVHATVRPEDLQSVTRSELRVIQLGVAAGLAVSVGLAPSLWPLIPIAAVGYLTHLIAVAPPADLARAWRRTPRPRAENANSAPPLSGP